MLEFSRKGLGSSISLSKKSRVSNWTYLGCSGNARIKLISECSNVTVRCMLSAGGVTSRGES